MSSRHLALALALAACTPHAAGEPEPEPAPRPTELPPVPEDRYDVPPPPPEPVRGSVLPPANPPGWDAPPPASQLPAGRARVLWTRPVSPAAGLVALVADEGGLAGVTWDNRVLSVAPTTGALRWSDAEPGTDESIDRPLVTLVAGVEVIAWPVERRVEGRGAERGEVRWSHPQRAPVRALTRCAGHRLVVFVTRERGGDDGARSVVVALDPETGGQVWRRPAPGQLLGEAEGAVWFGPEFVPGGRWSAAPTRKVVGLGCADGEEVARWDPPAPYVELHNGDAGRVLFSALERPSARRILCAVPARGDVAVLASTLACVHELEVLPGGQSLHGAALWGPRIYAASGHALARNLDPTPDASLVAYDLQREEVVGRSGADVASGDPVRAGRLWWTGFGSTGAKDQVHLVDPGLVTPVRTVATGKAPRAMAVDRERAYVGTYDGRLIAVEIPAEVRDPAPAPPQVHASAPVVVDEGAPRPVWRVDVTPAKQGLTAIAAVPARGSTGGMLLVGGRDRSLQLRRVADGAKVSAAPGLTRPIESLRLCPDGSAVALTSRDELLRVSWDEDGRRLRTAPIRLARRASTWQVQVSEDCGRAVFADLGGPLDVYRLATGALEASLRGVDRIDGRGLRTTGASMPASAEAGSELALYDLLGETIAPIEAPSLARAGAPVRLRNDDAELVQAFAIGKDRLLTEHCSAAACLLRLWRISGELVSTIEIDATGAGWSVSLPSTIAVAEHGGELWIAWYRRELDPMLLRASDGARMVFDVPAELIQPAFAPLDDALMVAWAGSPRNHQLSLFAVEVR